MVEMVVEEMISLIKSFLNEITNNGKNIKNNNKKLTKYDATQFLSK